MTTKVQIVKSVIKALDILEVLSNKGEQGVSEIARQLTLDRSTTFRIISTLKSKGYLCQNPENKKYSNSFKLFEMGNHVVHNMGLKKEAFPFLRDLAEKTHEAVNIAVRHDKSVIYIDKIESNSTIKVDLNIGRRVPLYCTGLGKIFLAFLPEDAVKALLSPEPFKQFTPQTLTDLKSIRSELILIRSQGYALDNEEYVEGLLCIAAPVFGYKGDLIASISVALPKYIYFDNTEKMSEIRDHVVAIAKKLSHHFQRPITNL